MMGAAMLKHHQFVWSLWALYRLVVSSITFVRHLYVGESGAALVYILINVRSTDMQDEMTKGGDKRKVKFHQLD